MYNIVMRLNEISWYLFLISTSTGEYERRPLVATAKEPSYSPEMEIFDNSFEK